MLFIAIIIIYFMVGGLMLFGTRVAQAGVLPTEQGCAPYDTRSTTKLDPITTNMFTTPASTAQVNTDDSQTNRNIDAEYVSKKLIIDIPSPDEYGGIFTATMTKLVHDPLTTSALAFFGTVANAVTAVNYSLIELIFGGLSDLPEMAIILGGPAIAPFLAAAIAGVSVLNIAYQWLTNLHILFWKNTNRDAPGDTPYTAPSWELVTPADGMLNYGAAMATAALMVGIFFTLVFTGGIAIWAGVGALACVLSAFAFRGTVDGKPYSALSAMIDALTQYKVPISYVVSAALIASSFNMFSPVVGTAALLVVAVVYWDVIPMQLFVKAPPLHNLTPIVKHAFAKKKCTPTHTYVGKTIAGQLLSAI